MVVKTNMLVKSQQSDGIYSEFAVQIYSDFYL